MSDEIVSERRKNPKENLSEFESLFYVDNSLKGKLKRYATKGNVANFVAFVIMIVGLVLTIIYPDNLPLQYILAFGLFAFTSGITNWIAIRMLFDRIPGLYGSGIIEAEVVTIRQTAKDLIIKTFFNAEYLNRYISEKAGVLLNTFDIEGILKSLLDSDVVDDIIDMKLEEIRQRPEGMWLAMMGVDNNNLKPMIKPLILGLSSDVAPMIVQRFDPSKAINVDIIKAEVEQLVTQKLEELTPSNIKHLLEGVMADHLGWLIIWGNIFGGAIGLATKAINVELDVFDISDFRF